MNSYQLISKLRKVRDNTYLTTSAQALYHELVAICNEMKWKEIFKKKNADLCSTLNMSDKTLIKSRKNLSDAGLIYFRTSKDKRIGCYYSFTNVLSSVYFPYDSTDDNTYDSTYVITHDTTDELTDDTIDETTVDNTNDIKVSSVLSSEESSVHSPYEKEASSVISSGKCTDDVQNSPIIDIKTINGDNHAHTRETPPSPKIKKSRKKEGDSKPLVYPFDSEQFMNAWSKLLTTPKWKKKLNLALQLSLDKLGRYEEEFAIEQIERAIESDWTGVVFSGTDEKYREWLNLKYGNNRKLSKADKARSLLEEYRAVASGAKQSPSDAEILDF